MRPRIGRVRGFVAKTQRPWTYTRPRNDDRRDWEGCPARFALPLHPLRVVDRQFIVCSSDVEGGGNGAFCTDADSAIRIADQHADVPALLADRISALAAWAYC